MKRSVQFGLDYESRPQWGIVNPEILGAFYTMIRKYSAYRSKRMRGVTGKTSEYYDWYEKLIETFLKLKAHLIEEEDKDFAELHDKLMKAELEDRVLDYKEAKECMYRMIEFVKRIGLTKVEVEKGGPPTLMGG